MRKFFAVVGFSAVLGVVLGLAVFPLLPSGGNLKAEAPVRYNQCIGSVSNQVVQTYEDIPADDELVEVFADLTCTLWGGTTPCSWHYNVWVVDATTGAKKKSLGCMDVVADCGQATDIDDSVDLHGLPNGSYKAIFGIWPGLCGVGNPDPDPNTAPAGTRKTISFTLPL